MRTQVVASLLLVVILSGCLGQPSVRDEDLPDDGPEPKEPPPDPDDGSADEGTVNVALDQNASRDRRDATFRLSVASTGNRTATGVTLRAEIPEPDGSARVAEGGDACTLEERNLTCRWQEMAAGDRRNVTVEATYDRCRTPENRATVSADRDDRPDDDEAAARLAPAEGCGEEDGSRSWPPKGQARIRPGVQMRAGGARCTVAFVLSDRVGARLYVTTASHCVGGMSVGDGVAVGGIDGAAVIVYCSWARMAGTGEDCPEDRPDGGASNDLAVLRIRDRHEGQVHPAVVGWGGPTGMADPPVAVGTRAQTTGASSLRAGALDGREGVVTGSGHRRTTVHFAPASVPGDSGSPVLSADGKAIGVLTTIVITPRAGGNGVVNLAPALEPARQATGIDLRLETVPPDGGDASGEMLAEQPPIG